jgi:hypothetical protein
MGLKELYETWQFRPIMNGANNTPPKQSEGEVAVDYLPNEYQAEIRNRTPGDKVVVQATDDDDTKGMFNKESAFKYYSTLITQYGTKSQIYKAQAGDTNKFVNSNSWKNSPGVLYSTNQS